jgi:LacI family transcriptional regulator
MTVSRTLRDDPAVSEVTRDRVLRSVATLGYRRNELARSLKLGRTDGVLGVVLANLANPFYAELALGVERWADQRGLRIMLADSAEDPAREQRLLQDFAARRFDGVLVVPTSDQHRHLDRAQLGGMPLVLATTPPSGIVADAVVLDDFGGARKATAELLARGHRRIAFLGLPASSWTGSERLRGYGAALESAGLDVDERHVLRGTPTVESARGRTRQLLALAEPPTAIFAANNRLTIGALRAVREQDAPTSLAGFDDIEYADLLDRPLLLVSYDAHELGARAAGLLGDLVDDPDGADRRHARRIVVPTELVQYGESVGAP